MKMVEMSRLWRTIQGRGYTLKRVVVRSGKLWFKLGYNRWVLWQVPQGVTILCLRKTRFYLFGKKEMVKQAAHSLRNLRVPSIYHRKGIHLSFRPTRKKRGKKVWTG